MDIPSTLCPICLATPESVSHVFLDCHVASNIWRLVFMWLDLSLIQYPTVGDMFRHLDDLQLNNVKKECIEAVFCSIIWVIWRHRNDIVFSPGRNRPDSLFDIILVQSHLWVTSRSRKVVMSRERWFQNPLLFL